MIHKLTKVTDRKLKFMNTLSSKIFISELVQLSGNHYYAEATDGASFMLLSVESLITEKR